MSTCTGCGESFRKGKRRNVLLPTGELVTRLVCGGCASRALAIVPVRRAALCTCCPGGDTREASVCARCSNEMAHRAVASALAPFIAHIRGLAKAYRLNDDPRAAGLEVAAEVLDAGRITGES